MRIFATSATQVMLIFALLLGISCSCRKNEDPTKMNSVKAVVYNDRRDCELEYVYIFGKEGVFCQVAKFPGYTNRKFYFISQLPAKLTDEASRWHRLSGEIEPPFIPSGPWYSRTIFTYDLSASPQEAFFKNTNVGLQKWFSELRAAVVLDANRIDVPPSWVQEDARIGSTFYMKGIDLDHAESQPASQSATQATARPKNENGDG